MDKMTKFIIIYNYKLSDSLVIDDYLNKRIV